MTLRLGMQFVIGSGGLTWFALISAGWERRPGPGPGPRPRKSASLPCDGMPREEQKTHAWLLLALPKGDGKATSPEVRQGHLFHTGLSRALRSPSPLCRQRCERGRRAICFLKPFRIGLGVFVYIILLGCFKSLWLQKEAWAVTAANVGAEHPEQLRLDGSYLAWC